MTYKGLDLTADMQDIECVIDNTGDFWYAEIQERPEIQGNNSLLKKKNYVWRHLSYEYWNLIWIENSLTKGINEQ